MYLHMRKIHVGPNFGQKSKLSNKAKKMKAVKSSENQFFKYHYDYISEQLGYKPKMVGHFY